MKSKTLMAFMVVLLIVSCDKSAAPNTAQEKGDAMERIQQLYHTHQFQDALAVCDSMLQNGAYRVDTLTADENNRRFITIMRRRILILGYLQRQVEAVNDMKALAEFCNNNTDDEENSYSSVAAQMDVKIGLAQIDMGRPDDGFAMIDKGINDMRDKTSKNARLATVNFMHDKAKALFAENREGEAVALSLEALERMKHMREVYADSFADNQDIDVQDFCEFYEGNFYAFLANVYVHKAERGETEAADSVRIYFQQAMNVPHFSEMPNSNIMLVGVYGFLNMLPEFEKAYRQIEEEFAQDTLAYYYIDVQRYAAQMAQKQGDNDRALAIMKRVARLQSMRIKDDTMKHVAEAANTYEVAEMQRTKQEMEVSRLKWIIMAVCLGFVTLSVCIALLFYYRRNRRAYSRYTAIIAKHDANEMVIRALKMDPNTPIDYLLTLTGEAQPEELERRFTLINGMSLDDFRTRLQLDDVKEEDTPHTNVETPEHDAFLAKLDKVLMTDDRILGEENSRKDIVRDMGMPMMHILEHLKEYTGCTLTAYITQKRLEYAANLLLTTQQKVEAVCYTSGFSSLATFYRLFTKHYGCPPAEYRASHIEKVLTDQKEEKERRMKEQKSNIDRNKGMALMLQNLCHEIRTPLNAMFGFSQLLSLPDGSVSEENKASYFNYIYNSYNMMSMLIDDVLDVADAEHGNFRVHMEEVRVNEICRTAIQMAEVRRPAHVNMYFTTDVDDSLVITSDGRRIQQVLINYLTNACKHTVRGEIHLHLSDTETPGRLTFSVTDTGEGIPADKAKDVFQRFKKLNDKVQGSGLGLNICSVIADMLNGEVSLDTSYTDGARFLFVV